MNEKHCRDYIDLLSGYALEILDGEDRLTLEQHLRLCTACRAEVTAVRETLHFCMGHALPLVAPDPLVRTKFLAQFAVEISPGSAADPFLSSANPPPNLSQSAASPPTAQLPLRPPILSAAPPPGQAARTSHSRPAISTQQRLAWLVSGAALPAVAAVLFCVLFLRSQNQLTAQRDNALAQALHTPHLTMHLTGTALRTGMNGEVLLQQHSGTGVLIVSGIHHVPSGMTYVWWMRKHGQWVDGGALHPDASGMAMVSFEGSTSFSGVDSVAITMEHSGRPAIPSSPLLLTSPI